MPTKVERSISAIFSCRHYGYFADLIRGVENTSLTNTNSRRTPVYNEPAIKINSWGKDINSPTPPEETSCLNLDGYNRIFGPYVESASFIESLGATRIDAIEGVKHITIF